jgi:hypothetical protein
MGGRDLRERFTEYLQVVSGGVGAGVTRPQLERQQLAPVLSQVTRIGWNPKVCL